ncbi:MAG: hypothetical protein CSA79_03595 [Thiothrix nivea]|nr:MAG: hypothetical protein CSA79_03595 [Thiothrix nivea]
MRNLLALPLIALFLVSCATTSMTAPMTETKQTDRKNTDTIVNKDNKTGQHTIDTITFVKNSPPIAANLYRTKTLTVNKDLSTRYEMKDGYNQLLNEKTGTITQQQFNHLADKLNTIAYTHIKSEKRSGPLVGSPTRMLIIKSNQGAHRFIDGAMTAFPAEIQAIFNGHMTYMPTAPATDSTD